MTPGKPTRLAGSFQAVTAGIDPFVWVAYLDSTLRLLGL